MLRLRQATVIDCDGFIKSGWQKYLGYYYFSPGSISPEELETFLRELRCGG